MSGQHGLHHFSVHIRQAESSSLMLEGQAFMVEAHAVQDRRIQIVNVHRILNDVVSVVVSLTEHMPATDAAAGKPHGDASTVVVSAIVVLKTTLAVNGSTDVMFRGGFTDCTQAANNVLPSNPQASVRVR